MITYRIGAPIGNCRCSACLRESAEEFPILADHELLALSYNYVFIGSNFSKVIGIETFRKTVHKTSYTITVIDTSENSLIDANRICTKLTQHYGYKGSIDL